MVPRVLDLSPVVAKSREWPSCIASTMGNGIEGQGEMQELDSMEKWRIYDT